MLSTRLPFHRHLKWLCIEGFSYDDVRAYYDDIQMAVPTKKHYEDALEEVSKLIVPPATLRRTVKHIHNPADQAIWFKHGFEEIYMHQVLGDGGLHEIGPVLNHPVMRVALECCMIAKLTNEEISQLLPSVYYLPISPESIDTYTKYFFNWKDMKKNDWQGYLDLIVEDRYSHNRVFYALTRPQEEVLHAVGLPTRSQFGTMLKNVMNTANYKFEHYSRQQSPEAQEQAMKWAKLMMDAGAKHEKFGSTDATDFSKLIQTQFEYLDAPVEDITPEMLADAKPPAKEPDQGAAAAAPAPPDTQNQQRNPNDI